MALYQNNRGVTDNRQQINYQQYRFPLVSAPSTIPFEFTPLFRFALFVLAHQLLCIAILLGFITTHII